MSNVVFKVSKTEIKTIFDELLEKSKDSYLDIAKLVYDKPYEYLFINTDSQRLFKGFDEILIEND